MGVCNCSMFCCMLLYVHSSIAIILMGRRELIALLNLSSWCLVMVERLFLAVPQGCLQFVIFPDHTHFLFLYTKCFAGIVAGYVYKIFCCHSRWIHIENVLLSQSQDMYTNCFAGIIARNIQNFCWNNRRKCTKCIAGTLAGNV